MRSMVACKDIRLMPRNQRIMVGLAQALAGQPSLMQCELIWAQTVLTMVELMGRMTLASEKRCLHSLIQLQQFRLHFDWKIATIAN